MWFKILGCELRVPMTFWNDPSLQGIALWLGRRCRRQVPIHAALVPEGQSTNSRNSKLGTEDPVVSGFICLT